MERDLTTLTTRVEEKSDQKAATVSEITDPQIVHHLTTGFFPTQIIIGQYDSLPYHQLRGAGLERLCYSLILAHGGVPRYFGNPGQEQYGIDLIVSDGIECVVYQCKNVNAFTRRNMAEALHLFEEKWLGHPKLPSPTKFVLCSPLPLRERKLNEDWTILERGFYERTGVRIEVWDKEFIDAKLRNLPDVVADLFSDQAAEWFCGLEDWNADLFRPVQFGSGEPTVNRYLEKKAAGQIYLDARVSEEFTRRLESYDSLLIRGLPGSGKTITGLALAESFRHGLYRLFFVNMRRDLGEDALVKGIRRRLARPTIFLLDDCHGKYEILEGVQDRLQEVVARQPGRAFLVYTARTTSTPEGMPRADYSGFVEEFKRAEAALEFRPTPELFASIVAVTKPDLRELSEERLGRIFNTTGRDLFLLDLLLDVIKSPDEIDRLEPAHLFEETLRRYFGQPTVHRPGFMLLTALAQFEIAPAVADFPYDLRGEDPKAAAQLLVEADRPLRYFFLHSSAAELVFRALAWNDRLDNHSEAAALKLIEYFGSRPPIDRQLPSDLSSVLRNRLKLRGDEGEESLLKSRLLADNRIFALIETVFERLSLNTVALLLNTLKSTDVAMFERYRDLVQRKIDDGTALKSLIASFPSQFLQLIKSEYPSWYSSLREQFADQGLRQWVRTREIRSLLIGLVTFAGQQDFILAGALDSVDDDEFDGLIQRTIISGRSIGNIHFQLRELKNTDLPLLEKLEQKIGPQRYLHLIVSNGTVFELFKVIEHSSSSMTAELIGALDEETLDVLIEKTIIAGRSIATLNLALRELKETDANLLEELEGKIGARRYLHLIVSAGTIFELFMVLRHSSSSMTAELIGALDEETLDVLIKKTIIAGRSIATLDLALRELKETDARLLEQLEVKIGARRYLHLIVSNGTVFELFRLIQHSSSSMTAELIGALDGETVSNLIEKTIASGRSIGTLSFTLRHLKMSEQGELNRLERRIGVDGWWKLILANGKINVLAPLMKYMDGPFRQEMIRASRRLKTADWDDLLLRGDFNDLTVFARVGEGYSPKLFTPALIKLLEPTFKKLIHQADWPVLKTSAYRLSESPDSELKHRLQQILEERLAETDIALLRFDTFEEAAGCISAFWRGAPSMRDELVRSLFNILPEEANWYGDGSFLRTARVPLFILASSRTPQDADRRMLDLCNNGKVAALVGHVESLDILLYLWNLYGLWFKCKRVLKREAGTTFAAFLDPEIRAHVHRILDERLRSGADQMEKERLVSLCGFLHASGLGDFREGGKAAWLSSLPPFDKLLAKAEKMKSFLVTSFFLIGLGWIFDRNIPEPAFARAMTKASSYGVETDAFNNLRRLLSARVR